MIDRKSVRVASLVAVVGASLSVAAGPPAQLGEVSTTLVDAGAAPRQAVRVVPVVGATARLDVRIHLEAGNQPPMDVTRPLEVRVERVDGDRVTLRLESTAAKITGSAVVTTRGRLISLEASAPPSDDSAVQHDRQAMLATLDLIKETWAALGDLAPEAAAGANARWRTTRTIVKGPMPTHYVVELTRVAEKPDERLATRATMTMSGKLPAPSPPVEAMSFSGSGKVEVALLAKLPWPRRLSVDHAISFVMRATGLPESKGDQTIKGELDFVFAP
jgi:hypothetical protein